MVFEVHIIQSKRISKYLKEEVKKKVLNMPTRRRLVSRKARRVDV